MTVKEPLISFQNVSKGFSGRTILNGITLQLFANETLVILGPSGTGKSVLLKMAIGLLQPDTGDILFGEKEYSKLQEEDFLEVRRKIGLIFQLPALIENWNAYENVAFALRKVLKLNESACKESVFQIFNKLGLSGVQLKYPHELSVGETKKLSVARCLVLKPEIVLFDEPTTSLDPQSTSAINKIIFELKNEFKVSSIVVSHDMQSALKIADRIIVLENGKIIGEGTPAEIQLSQNPTVKGFLKEGLWSLPL